MRAATELAREIGPAHLSLDAVAARAGLSKGGLLYSFPTKAKLLEAVVEEYMKEHEHAMEVQETLQKGDKTAWHGLFSMFTGFRPMMSHRLVVSLPRLPKIPVSWCRFADITGHFSTA